MLKLSSRWVTLSTPSISPFCSNHNHSVHKALRIWSFPEAVKFGHGRLSSSRCEARRRVRYNSEDDGDGDGDEEEYGHNVEIGMLELYSQSAREEALLVQAIVDGQQVEVLIFKGFSSCLSYKTSPDPSRSVIPARAAIKSIDRIKGPFNPSNIEYLEKGLTWETFKNRLHPN